MDILELKVKLGQKEPWLANLILGIPVEITDCSSIAYTDGQKIFMNKQFVENSWPHWIEGVFMHELLHIVFSHTEAMRNKNQTLFNIATDAVINHNLLKCNYSLPHGCIKLSELCEQIGIPMKDYTAEELYQILQKHPLPNLPDFRMDIVPSSNPVSTKTIWQTIDWQAQKTKLQNQILQSHGLIKGSEQVTVNKIKTKTPKWIHRLAMFLRNKQTTTKPHRRSIIGVYDYLALANKPKGTVTIGIDTSGSINKHILEKNLGYIEKLVYQYPNINFTLVTFDTEIQQVIPIRRSINKINFKGRGGTDFCPIIQWAKNSDLLVVFTDGMGKFPKQPPKYPIFWVLYENYPVIPYGEVFIAE